MKTSKQGMKKKTKHKWTSTWSNNNAYNIMTKLHWWYQDKDNRLTSTQIGQNERSIFKKGDVEDDSTKDTQYPISWLFLAILLEPNGHIMLWD